MSTIQSLFEQAQLAEAAYANFFDNAGNLDTSNSGVSTALQIKGIAPAQAAAFVTQWSVIDQYIAPAAILGVGGTGFSATLFKNIQTGAYTFAIRGTEPGPADLLGADLGDIVMDGIAMDQLVDMYNYWQSLTHTGNYQAAKLEIDWAATAALTLLGPLYIDTLKAEGAILDTTTGGTLVRRIRLGDSTDLLADTALALGSGKLSVCPLLNVTGHSLGGHLAAAFTRLFPDTPSSAITVNGAGFPTGITPGLGGNALSNIQNLFSRLHGASAFDPARIQNVYGDGPTFVTMNSEYGLVQPGLPPQEIYIESSTSHVLGHGADQMTDSLALYSLFATLDPTLNTANPADGIAKITGILKAASNVAKTSLEKTLDALRTLFEQNYAGSNSNLNAPPTATDDRQALYTNLNALKTWFANSSFTGFNITTLADKDAGSLLTQALADTPDGLAYRYALYKLNPFVVSGASALYDAINTDGALNRYDSATDTGNLTDQYLKDRVRFMTWKNLANTQDKTTLAGPNGADNWQFTDLASNYTLNVMGQVLGFDSQNPFHKIVFDGDAANWIDGGTEADYLYGGGGDDIIKGFAGNDYLEGQLGADELQGGAGNDTLVGGQGADVLVGGDDSDTLFGGAGADILDGGNGNDILKGGAGNDTYAFSGSYGFDLLTDSDGSGSIQVDGQTLTTATQKIESVYQNATGQTFIKLNGGTSLVLLKENTPNRIIVTGWTPGNLGLSLQDQAPTIPATTLTGDFKKAIDDKGTAAISDDEYVMTNGNYTKDTSAPDGEPGALDLISGTAGNDVIDGMGGDDALSGKGGDDYILGGEGADAIQGGLGKDTLIGGAGDDGIYGSSDADLKKPINVDFTRPENTYAHPQGTGFNWCSGYNDTYANGVPDGYSSAFRDRWDGDQGNLIDGGTGNDFIAAGTGAANDFNYDLERRSA